MLISGAAEEGSAGEGVGVGRRGADEYRAADELFELMAGDHRYDIHDGQSLSTTDLVILYKNMDVDTKQTPEAAAAGARCCAPNQRVVTVVHRDEQDSSSDDSEVCEMYSNDDLREVFSINDERIDLINNVSAVRNPLCHKFGNVKIQSSNLTTGYDNHFLFKDPYIEQQLKNSNILPDGKPFDTVLPASLLDYICCKSLEDNYSFYMDNMIRYVQHTIEQLKRISNGDYLTDRAKEKWREVAQDLVMPRSDATKVLATSVSIPIHVMSKPNGRASTWDDIVHSEVDVRSLTKILEQKIIIEVPKLISGLRGLFCQARPDNLIISCKRDTSEREEESRVGVVLKIKPSESEHVISHMNSIMILEKIPCIAEIEPSEKEFEEIQFGNYNEPLNEPVKIVEIDDEEHKEETNCRDDVSAKDVNDQKSTSDTSDCSLLNNFYFTSCQSSVDDKGLLNDKVERKSLKTETDFPLMSPDELHCTIQRLNIQTPVPEEVEEPSLNKKKSQTRVRIKSPYENKSYFIEEKKRKKLLEIREKREKKKMALSENCKISKHKNARSAVMAQPSSSVTKLSITNKSFYNSIYGESLNHESGIPRKPRKPQRKEIGLDKQECENGFLKSSITSLGRSSLCDDNSETMTQMQQNIYPETSSSPISAVSNYIPNSKVLSQLIGSSTDLSTEDDSSPGPNTERDEDKNKIHEDDYKLNDLVISQSSACILVPVNTPKARDLAKETQKEVKTMATPVECRKSIDKIYNLLKKVSKHDNDQTNNSFTLNESTILASDSGTSINHRIISSNPSSFNIEKNNINLSRRSCQDKKNRDPAALVPKVIIGSKLQAPKVDNESRKTDRKRNILSPSTKVPENPLKAISQLLHEFDNVQKTRHNRSHRKVDQTLARGSHISQQNSPKKLRPEQPRDIYPLSVKSLAPKERKHKVGQPLDPAQLSQQIKYVDDRHVSRSGRRNISDIIDEAKEARGEAVRGPPRLHSRLNTLAQPKKSYMQAQSEEYHNKHGRNGTTHRPQRAPMSAPVVEKNMGNINARIKRKAPEIASVASAKPAPPPVPPIERMTRPRRSSSNSPVRKRVPQPTTEDSSRPFVLTKSPDLKKKMVAVESYVKSHYGLAPVDTSELVCQEVQKSRVPLIPNDIELASLTSSPTAEESSALGKQLHYMVDTMINTNAPVLSVLTECKESMSKLTQDGLEKLSSDSFLKMESDCPVTKSDSDYPVDIFEDKNIKTAVASIPKDKSRENKVVDGNIDAVETYNVQPFNSMTEIRKLENALYQQMSVGAFPKRLRIKNLTLTPKHSLQQVILVHSGDAGSLLVKSSLSPSLRTNDSKTDSLSALKSLAALSNTDINWGSTNIPLQVATIGYAFPTYHSTSHINTFNNYEKQPQKKSLNEYIDKHACKYNKISQCFKGVPTEPCLEQATQANIIRTKCHLNTNTSEHNESHKIKEMCGQLKSTTDLNKAEDNITFSKLPFVEAELPMESCKDMAKEDTPFVEAKLPMESCKDMANEDTISNPTEIINQSTSLDILMGLLNEIRKITGENINSDAGNEKELQIILNNNTTQESSVDINCRELVSVTSLDKLHQIHTKPTVYSYSLLKDENRIDITDIAREGMTDISIDCGKPQNEDKWVSVDIEKQYKNTSTAVPSCLFPVTVAHTNNITDNIEIIRRPSTQSVYSIARYETICYNPSNSCFDMHFEERSASETKFASAVGIPSAPDCLNVFSNEDKVTLLRREPSAKLKLESTAIVRNSYCANNVLTNNCLAIRSDFDSIMRTKRDILVTVYSILVFTIFAALSFPKFFY